MNSYLLSAIKEIQPHGTRLRNIEKLITHVGEMLRTSHYLINVAFITHFDFLHTYLTIDRETLRGRIFCLMIAPIMLTGHPHEKQLITLLDKRWQRALKITKWLQQRQTPVEFWLLWCYDNHCRCECLYTIHSDTPREFYILAETQAT